MEKKVILLPFVALILGLLSEVGGSAAQELCHGMVCPEYTVVRKYEDFEERSYVQTRWITTKVPSYGTIDLIEGFSRLKKYCQGQNEAGTMVPRNTWPALITVTEGEDGTERELSVSWYVSAETVLPKPTDPSVVEESRPAGIVYVRSFGGLANEKLGRSNAMKLREDLEWAKKSFEPHKYTGAGYDQPYDIFHPHHNEVWLYAASEYV